MEKFELKKGMSRNEIFEYKIGIYKNKEWKLTQESLFSNELEKHLEQLFNDLNRPVEKILREFSIQGGRLDFLLVHPNKQYTIIEVKYSRGHSNDESRCSNAVGQLFNYKTTLCRMYDVPKENVNLMIVNNQEFFSVLDNILFNELKIEYLVFGDKGVKYYGIE